MAITPFTIDINDIAFELTAPHTAVPLFSLDMVTGEATSAWLPADWMLVISKRALILFNAIDEAERKNGALTFLQRFVNASPLDDSVLGLSVSAAGDVYTLSVAIAAGTGPAHVIVNLPYGTGTGDTTTGSTVAVVGGITTAGSGAVVMNGSVIGYTNANTIAPGAVTNAMVAAGAGIEQSKIAGLVTDLSAINAALATKANDNAVVKLTGAQTIAGVKTFTSAPVVPTNAFPESAVANLVNDLAAINTALGTKADASTVVTLTGTQDISGLKTFTASQTNFRGALGLWDGSTYTYGTAGQILVSAGPGVPPTWTSVAPGGVTSVLGTANEVTASTTAGVVTLSLPATIDVTGITLRSSTTLVLRSAGGSSSFQLWQGNVTTAGNFNISAGNSVVSGVSGAVLQMQGGAALSGNANGGSVLIFGGSGIGTGTAGTTSLGRDNAGSTLAGSTVTLRGPSIQFNPVSGNSVAAQPISASTATALTLAAGASSAASGAGGLLTLRGGAGGTDGISGGVTIEAGDFSGTGFRGAVTIGSLSGTNVGIGNSTGTTAVTGVATFSSSIVANGGITGNSSDYLRLTTASGTGTLRVAPPDTTNGIQLLISGGRGNSAAGAPLTLVGGVGATGFTGGTVNIDGGYSPTTLGVISIGTRASSSGGGYGTSAVNIGRTGVTTTVNGPLTVVGNLSASATTFSVTDLTNVSSIALANTALIFKGTGSVVQLKADNFQTLWLQAGDNPTVGGTGRPAYFYGGAASGTGSVGGQAWVDAGQAATNGDLYLGAQYATAITLGRGTLSSGSTTTVYGTFAFNQAQALALYRIDTGATLDINGSNPTIRSVFGQNLTIAGSDGGGDGGNLTLRGGNTSVDEFFGGNVTLQGGTATGVNGDGGSITIEGGDAGFGGSIGTVSIGRTGAQTSIRGSTIVLFNTTSLATNSFVVASPATADNSTKIATTAYVKNQGYLTVADALTTFAQLVSPAFTGNPTAPTQAAGNNSTRIATTAFVQGVAAEIYAATNPSAFDTVTGTTKVQIPGCSVTVTNSTASAKRYVMQVSSAGVIGSGNVQIYINGVAFESGIADQVWSAISTYILPASQTVTFELRWAASTPAGTLQAGGAETIGFTLMKVTA